MLRSDCRIDRLKWEDTGWKRKMSSAYRMSLVDGESEINNTINTQDEEERPKDGPLGHPRGDGERWGGGTNSLKSVYEIGVEKIEDVRRK